MSENIVDSINKLMADSYALQEQARVYAKLSEQAYKRAKMYGEYSERLSTAVRVLCNQTVELARVDHAKPSDPAVLYELVLKDPGTSKVGVAKEIQAAVGLSYKSAKFIADHAPAVVVTEASKDKAAEIQKRLFAVGATVEIQERTKD